MSPVAIALDLLLVSLLVLTLVLGVRLNGRLKSLKQSHAGFEKAVAELNQAAARAEAGLAALRETTAEAHDALLERIDTARALTTRLERATFQAEKAAEAVVKAKAERPAAAGASQSELAPSRVQTPSPPMSSALATIAALVGDGPRSPVNGGEASASRIRAGAPAAAAALARRGRSTFDEDLFEGEEIAPVLRPPSVSIPLSASDARLSGLRSRPKDDRL
jgi:hypothetical protein